VDKAVVAADGQCVAGHDGSEDGGEVVGGGKGHGGCTRSRRSAGRVQSLARFALHPRRCAPLPFPSPIAPARTLAPLHVMPPIKRTPVPPPKQCASCHRPFTWRKKWERDWDHVRYCSDACRRRGPREALAAEPVTRSARRGAAGDRSGRR
jgi:hypothetical protein